MLAVIVTCPPIPGFLGAKPHRMEKRRVESETVKGVENKVSSVDTIWRRSAFTAPKRKVLTGKGSHPQGRSLENCFLALGKCCKSFVQLGFCCTSCCKPNLWPTAAICVYSFTTWMHNNQCSNLYLMVSKA